MQEVALQNLRRKFPDISQSILHDALVANNNNYDATVAAFSSPVEEERQLNQLSEDEKVAKLQEFCSNPRWMIIEALRKCNGNMDQASGLLLGQSSAPPSVHNQIPNYNQNQTQPHSQNTPSVEHKLAPPLTQQPQPSSHSRTVIPPAQPVTPAFVALPSTLYSGGTGESTEIANLKEMRDLLVKRVTIQKSQIIEMEKIRQSQLPAATQKPDLVPSSQAHTVDASGVHLPPPTESFLDLQRQINEYRDQEAALQAELEQLKQHLQGVNNDPEVDEDAGAMQVLPSQSNFEAYRKVIESNTTARTATTPPTSPTTIASDTSPSSAPSATETVVTPSASGIFQTPEVPNLADTMLRLNVSSFTPVQAEPSVQLEALAEGSSVKCSWNCSLSCYIPNKKDWIDLFIHNREKSRTMSSPTGGAPNGEHSFMNLPDGYYDVRYFMADGTRIAKSDAVLVGSPVPLTAQFQDDETAQWIVVTWQVPTEPVATSPNDWIGLYELGQMSNRQFKQKLFCRSNPLTFPAPRDTKKRYELRYFKANSGVAFSGRSEPLTIPNRDSLLVTPNYDCTVVDVKWIFHELDPSTSDWIGLFEFGADNKQYLCYEYCTRSNPAHESGTLRFNTGIINNKQLPVGEYEFRFFSGNGGKYEARMIAPFTKTV